MIYFSKIALGDMPGRTKQNFDIVIGANYIGVWVLTHLLLDKVKKSRPSRVVSISSHTAWLQVLFLVNFQLKGWP